jgi:hypothetical protein
MSGEAIIAEPRLAPHQQFPSFLLFRLAEAETMLGLPSCHDVPGMTLDRALHRVLASASARPEVLDEDAFGFLVAFRDMIAKTAKIG